MTVRSALLLLLLLLPVAAFADGREVYTVANVPVDATAASAAAARVSARADGERRAYQILMARLTRSTDQAQLPKPTEEVLETLIGAFQVANERTSSVRYLANYTYHFRPDAVRQLLHDNGIPYCDTPSKPAIVLAVLDGAQPMLWEDPNPWRDAWNAHPPGAGLVPLITPEGDLADLQAIDAEAALTGDRAKLQAISARYQNADVLVTEAAMSTEVAPHTLTVKTTRYFIGGELPPASASKTYVAAADESDADLYAAAVAGTAAALEDGWKQANLLDLSTSAVLTATVPTGSLAAFLAVRDRLAQVPAITQSDLLSLDRDTARFAIHYHGTIDQLRVALAQRDLTLGGADPSWTIAENAPTPAEGAPAAPASQ